MKYAKYSIENTTIEVYNSISGIESVNVNGRKISQGFSFFGRDHFFKIDTDNYRIRPELSFFHLAGTAIRVYKNGAFITPKNLISKRNKNWLVIRGAYGIILGGVVGWYIGPTIEWILQVLGF